jgi:hypothetical protein
MGRLQLEIGSHTAAMRVTCFTVALVKAPVLSPVMKRALTISKLA